MTSLEASLTIKFGDTVGCTSSEFSISVQKAQAKTEKNTINWYILLKIEKKEIKSCNIRQKYICKAIVSSLIRSAGWCQSSFDDTRSRIPSRLAKLDVVGSHTYIRISQHTGPCAFFRKRQLKRLQYREVEKTRRIEKEGKTREESGDGRREAGRR